MTDNEKKLLQAQHRLEEAQMRNRDKERKARTRRLIQEGAILEKVYPAAAEMDLEKLEDFLYWALQYYLLRGAFGKPNVPFLLSRRAQVIPTEDDEELSAALDFADSF